jgi:hypothetical protein
MDIFLGRFDDHYDDGCISKHSQLKLLWGSIALQPQKSPPGSSALGLPPSLRLIHDRRG